MTLVPAGAFTGTVNTANGDPSFTVRSLTAIVRSSSAAGVPRTDVPTGAVQAPAMLPRNRLTP